MTTSTFWIDTTADESSSEGLTRQFGLGGLGFGSYPGAGAGLYPMSPLLNGGVNPLLQRPPPYPSFGGAPGTGYGPSALTPFGSYPSMGQQHYGAGAFPTAYPSAVNTPYQPIAAQNPYYAGNNAFKPPYSTVGSPYNPSLVPPTNYPTNSYNPSLQPIHYPTNSYKPSMNYPTNGYSPTLSPYPNNNYNQMPLSNYPGNYQSYPSASYPIPSPVVSDQNSAYQPSHIIPDPFSIQGPVSSSNYNSPGIQYQQPSASSTNQQAYRPVVIENPNYASQQNNYPSSSSQNVYSPSIYQPSSSSSLYNQQQSYRPVIQASIQEIPNDVPIYYPTKKPNHYSSSSSVFFPRD